MFERVTDQEERGQVGIGTLIVFIAMVLVAAIAAGVLLNTAGLLQSQAEATGQESTAQVSNVVQIDSATGHVIPEVDEDEIYNDVEVTIVDDHDEDLATIDLTYETDDEGGEATETFGDIDTGDDSAVLASFLAANDVVLDNAENDGATDITDTAELTVLATEDQDEIVITVTGTGTDELEASSDAEYESSDAEGEIGEVSMMVSLGPGADAIDLGSATFEFVGDTTERGTVHDLEDLEIQDLNNEGVDDMVLQSGENLQIYLDLEAGNDDFNTIGAGEDAEFAINTADGSQTVEVLQAPSTLTDDAVTL